MNSISGWFFNTNATFPRTVLALSLKSKLPVLNNTLSEISTYTTPLSTLIFTSWSLRSPIAPFRFITKAIFIESFLAAACWMVCIYASLEPMLSKDFLMLSACEEEITERSSNCFNAWLLFFFKNSTCSFIAASCASRCASAIERWRSASAFSSRQALVSICAATNSVLSLPYLSVRA